MRKFLNKYIFIILIFYAFYLIALPVVFSKIVPIISENISYNSDYSIVLENPKLVLNIIPKAVIKSDNVIFRSKSENKTLSVKNFTSDIRLLPLLSGKLHVNKLSADDIYLKMELQKTFSIDKDLITSLAKSNVKCDFINIQKLDVSIRQPNAEDSIRYTAKNIIYKKNARYLNFNVDSTLCVENQTSDIKAKLFLPQNNNVNKSFIDIDIINLDVAPVCEFLKDYIPADIQSARGIINVDVDKDHLDVTFNNFAIFMKDSVKSIIFPSALNAKSNIKLTSESIALEKLNVLADGISMSISGKVSNYMNKQASALDLKIHIDKSKVQNFIKMLPTFKTEDIDGYKLKKYGFNGDVIANLAVKGDFKEPSVNGDIYINNGVLIEPIKNAEGAVIKLKFTGKYLNFDVFVPAGNSEKVWVKGGVELYNVKYSDMRIWSTKNVSLETAQSKVVPLHEILNFVIGPVPIMDINGIGNIDITVKGNRKNPHVWGVFNVRDTKTKFLEIPDLLLTNADAVLEFNDENARFTLNKGHINDKDVNIDGTCTLAGKFDFDVSSKNQDIKYFYQAIKTSTIIDDIKNILPDFENIGGDTNIKLKVYGNIKDIYQLHFNKNFFVKGSVELLNNYFKLKGVEIYETKGVLDFDGTNAFADVTSMLGKSTLKAKGSIKQDMADLDIKIPHLNLADIFSKNDEIIQSVANVIVDINAKYKGKPSEVEFDKIDLCAKIMGTGKNNRLHMPGGTIILKNDKLQIQNLSGNFEDKDNAFDVNIELNRLSKEPILTGNLFLKNFNLMLINKLSESPVLPKNIHDALSKIRFDKGKINLTASIRNNNINASTNLGGINFTYVPLNIPIHIVNGSLYAKRDKIELCKINMLADEMPILIDGKIDNIFSKKDFDVVINSKLQQDFIDEYFNNHTIYPLKIKGNIASNFRLKGWVNNYELSSTVNLDKESSIYYMGATLGDLENDIFMSLKTQIINQNIFKIKEFTYDKIISSLGSRKTKLNMLKASGGIDIVKDDIIFRDMQIKTSKPTDARIFNIIFRKPNIKQGQFVSNLKLNGKLSAPNVLGTFHIFETNIPFFDTTMKNINFVFKDKTIDISSNGEILGNDINFRGTLRNKLTKPYYIENAYLQTKILDLNYITNKLRQSQIEEVNNFSTFENIGVSNFVIKNLKLSAEQIILRNLSAQNIEAQTSLNEKNVLNVSDFSFKVANGTLAGNYLYNMGNNRTTLNLKAKDIDANDITYAIFNLKNQIYGNLTGDVNLSCNGANFDKCMETLSGKTVFNVTDGKMPKLGSLEYLLKAGNLVRGGITGVSVNGVIDILTPLKTGNFSSIYGSINIKDGIANDIEISTKGKDLNLFITGTYRFADANADMEVFGLLSKKISTMFGPLGNVSLNTLLNVIPGVDLSSETTVLESINKIPGIEFSNQDFRKFIAIIKGNINSDNYVSSFKWIN